MKIPKDQRDLKIKIVENGFILRYETPTGTRDYGKEFAFPNKEALIEVLLNNLTKGEEYAVE